MIQLTEEMRPAGIVQRIIAGLIDLFIVYAFISLFDKAFFYLIKIGDVQYSIAERINAFFDLSMILFYFVMFESSKRRATIGKMLLNLQVTDLDKKRITFIRSLSRNIAKIISIVPLFAGFLFILFSKRKQALHDIISGCLIVQNRESKVFFAILASFLVLFIAFFIGLLLVIFLLYLFLKFY